MALNINKIEQQPGKRQEPIDPGPYPARVVQVIDLGLQKQFPWKGKEKPPAYKIHITYELVDEFMLDDEGNEETDQPRWVSEDFPVYSLSAENAKSTERYNAIDPECIHEGDFGAVGGMACTVNVVNKAGKGANAGKVYDNVGGVSTIRKRDAANCPELVNEVVMFDLDNPDIAVFNDLPDFLQNKIKSNLEFEQSKLQVLLGGGVVPTVTASEVEGVVAGAMSEVSDEEGGDEKW